MEQLIHNNIIVKKSAIHGYGVFATQTITTGSIIESCYCIFTDHSDPHLHNFYFGYHNKNIIPTGFGFIYNHSASPNADYYFDETKNLMIITAKRAIRAHEEIFISYGDKWFSKRKMPLKKLSLGLKIARYLKGAPLRASIVFGSFFLVMHLMHVLTVSLPKQKILQILTMTTQPASNVEKPSLVENTPFRPSMFALMRPSAEVH